MILKQFEKQGYARFPLNEYQQDLLRRLRIQTDIFSRRDLEFKTQFQVEKLNNGYRPLGSAHAGDPDQVDFNDSFLYWDPERSEQLRPYASVGMLLKFLEEYRTQLCVPLMQRLVSELQGRYGYEHDLSFEDSSFLQVNSFHTPTDRELLQSRHEDGVVATIIWTSAPGLELYSQGGLVPVTPEGYSEVLIMPGGILDLMTGGQFSAMYHQARNHSVLDRKSIMYFSTFDHDKYIAPFAEHEAEDVDIAAVIKESAEVFGSPAGFYAL